MPYFYEIDPSLDTIFTRHIGIVACRELTSQLKEIQRHRAYKPGMAILFDHREEVPPDYEYRIGSHSSKLSSPSQREIQQLSETLEGFGPIKIACVIEKEMVELFQSLRQLVQSIETINSRIFFTVEEASDWLNLPSKSDIQKKIDQLIFVTEDSARSL